MNHLLLWLPIAAFVCGSLPANEVQTAKKPNFVVFISDDHSMLDADASFENEPKNFIGMCQRFPQAIHVFVDSVCSDHPASPAEDAFLLVSWAIKRSRTRS